MVCHGAGIVLGDDPEAFELCGPSLLPVVRDVECLEAHKELVASSREKPINKEIEEIQLD